jgi:hypothetical protein
MRALATAAFTAGRTEDCGNNCRKVVGVKDELLKTLVALRV